MLRSSKKKISEVFNILRSVLMCYFNNNILHSNKLNTQIIKFVQRHLVIILQDHDLWK